MSLFGFGDIKFNNNDRTGFGPLAALEGTAYERNTFRYPTDVGAFDKGHYMVFYVREQNKDTIVKGNGMTGGPDEGSGTDFPSMSAGSEQYWNIRTGSELTSKLTSGTNQIKSAAGNMSSSFTSKISSMGGMGGFDSVPSSIGDLGSRVKGGLGNIFGQTNILKGNSQTTTKLLDTSIKKITNSRFINTTKRTTEAVALYMPDTLMYNHTQSYSSISMGKGAAGTILKAGRAAVEEFQKSRDAGASKFDASLKATAAAASDLTKQGAVTAINTTGEGSGMSLAILGQIQNPMLEMAYSAPNFRKFQFDFFFYPRDETEALEVQNILDRFKYHQAPSMGGDGGENRSQGGTLTPPSEFDIKFYYGAGENPNIPQIAEGCVLETIDVNYAPNGASFYEVPGENIAKLGRTGMPVGVQLTLNFSETNILTKNDLRNPNSDGTK